MAKKIWEHKIDLKITTCVICEKKKTCFNIVNQGFICDGCISHYYSNCGGRAEK